MFQVNILTLFPEMFPGYLEHSIVGRGLKDGKWSLNTTNIRDFATDKHQTVDDTPYGGGAGMVMRADVVAGAIDSVKNPGKRLYMSPRGKPLTQAKVRELATEETITILCGRYEGVDERVLESYDIEPVSIGDYVLSGGEIAAMVLIDACVRNVSGVIGNPHATEEESFGDGDYGHLLEYPLYTRPEEWQGKKVPDVLLSGHHKEIAKWRLQQAETITKAQRPDLWEAYKSKK